MPPPFVVSDDVLTSVLESLGLHSMAREVVLGHLGRPVPTGQMVYRVTLPAERLRGIPNLEEIVSVPRNNHWLGPHGTVLSYLLEGAKEPLVNLVFTSVQEVLKLQHRMLTILDATFACPRE